MRIFQRKIQRYKYGLLYKNLGYLKIVILFDPIYCELKMVHVLL